MTNAAPAWDFISKCNMNCLIGGYDRYTRIEQLYSYNEIPMLKKYIKVLAMKLYACAKVTRNWYIKKSGSDSLVDNRRVPKFSHILS